jgi:hypothetical protein
MYRLKASLLCLICLVLLFPGTPVFAQQAGCPATELGMNVVLPNGKTLKGLKLENLTGQTKHDRVAIDSLAFNTSPRRILMVLDMGRDLNADVRRAQIEIAAYLVTAGRPTDSMALLTARGALKTVRFGESHEAVLNALAELRDSKTGPFTENGILDAVMEGVGWFQNPAPGDAIIVMASEIEKNKSTRYSQVAKALEEQKIRLFSVALGPIMAGTFFGPLNAFAPHNEGWAFAANAENLSTLTWNSGGYMLFEDTKDPWKDYKLTDAHLQKLLEEAAGMYVAIATFYRVNVRAPLGLKRREGWKLDLTEEIRKKVPQAYMVYPRLLEPCLSQTSKN